MKKEYIAEIEYEANKMVDIVEILLKRQKKEIIEEIENLKKSDNSRDYNFGGKSSEDRKHNEMRGMDNIYGYNQAIEDIIKILN